MAGSSTAFDVLIAGARVVDGTGNPWTSGDVALAGGRIAAVVPPGRIEPSTALEIVDATGLVVCPGFIDILSHSVELFRTDGRSISKVTQGVTTEIMGEGWTPEPFGRWLAGLEARGVSVNIGSFVGGGTIRRRGMGPSTGAPTPAELAAMRDALARSMREGAFGLATALAYPPGAFAGTDELTALCEVVAANGGVHAVHLRSESTRLLEALDEALLIAERTGVATEIYHLKASGRPNWAKLPAVIDRIDAARAAGLDVTADMYPYVAAGTGLSTCLPPWVEADGRLSENLRDHATRRRVRHEMLYSTADWDSLGATTGPEHVVLAGLGKAEHLRYLGRTLADVAAERGQDWVDTVLDLLASEERGVFCFFFAMSEENLRLQMRQPWVAFATDAFGADPEAIRGPWLPHPRGFGTYPRILGRYVREEGVLSVEEAVHKMSGSVAGRLGLRDRGLLRAGMYADVVLFDPAAIADRATFADPYRLSVGVRDVWVNGARVLHDGAHTGALPGRRLFGSGQAPGRHERSAAARRPRRAWAWLVGGERSRTGRLSQGRRGSAERSP